MTDLPPFMIFFVAAGLALVTRGPLRVAIMLATPLLAGAILLQLPHGAYGEVALFDYTLTTLRVDKLSLLFGYLFVLAAFLSILFSVHSDDTRQHVSGLLYAGSALGAVFSGDLITLVVFWELLALTSVFLILARDTMRAYRAAMRYLLVQVLAGVVLLAGIIVRSHDTGSIAFDFIELDGLGAWLILLAVGIKCGFPLVHNWITDSYPEATPTGAAFLCAFTTKVGIYTLARAFPGVELLIYVGAVMTMFPIFYAIIENDLRRVLTYSMINQIGFMVCGIGLGSALAVNGAVAHAFNDVIFKGLLFMTMGAVLFRTGTTKASQLGGLYKSMPWTTGFCMVGAASISALPLFSGFVSKSMVMIAVLQEGHPIVWLALLFASAGVLEHAGIKIPYFAFFAHDSGIRVREAPKNMLIAMGLAAAICIFNGIYPWVLYDLLPFAVDYAPFEGGHVLTQIQLLLFASVAVAALMLSGIYPPELRSTNLDADWIYRRLGRAAMLSASRWAETVWAAVAHHTVRTMRAVADTVYRTYGPDGVLARSWPTGVMAFWTTVMLAAYLVFFYL